MDFVLGIIVAFVFGLIMDILEHLRTARGMLRIDHSNPEKDVYRIEIDDLDDLAKKSRVVLKVDHDAYLSQE